MNIYSIFTSISGEAGIVPQGTPTLFIRLAGCNLRCSWCDTNKSWDIADNSTVVPVPQLIDRIYMHVRMRGLNHILFTGGEPLIQARELFAVIRGLRQQIKRPAISIETNGSIFPQQLPRNINWVVDYKLPGSGQSTLIPDENQFHDGILRMLRARGKVLIKYVCVDRRDFLVARKHFMGLYHRFPDKMLKWALSPVHLSPAILARWLLRDWPNCDTTLSLQLHKYIWPKGEKEKP